MLAQLKDIGLGGLTSAEAVARLRQDGPNELPTAKKRNLVQQAWDVIREPMLLLLLGAGAANFLLAAPLDGAILMAFVLVVIGIEIYQEHKTESALAALRDLSSPRALAVRDGERVRIPLGFAATLLVVLLAVPGLRDAFHFGLITWTDGLIALGAGFVGTLWFEVYKAFAAAKQRDQTA